MYWCKVAQESNIFSLSVFKTEKILNLLLWDSFGEIAIVCKQMVRRWIKHLQSSLVAIPYDMKLPIMSKDVKNPFNSNFKITYTDYRIFCLMFLLHSIHLRINP